MRNKKDLLKYVYYTAKLNAFKIIKINFLLFNSTKQQFKLCHRQGHYSIFIAPKIKNKHAVLKPPS